MKFRTDSPFFQFVSTLTDFIVLNLIFLITCIPVITTGAAVTALYSVTLKEARGEHGYFVRTYMNTFRESFKKSTIVFLIYFIIGSVLLFNIVFWLQIPGITGNLFLILVTLLSLLHLVSAFYVFPLISRFENSLLQTIKNSLLIGLSNRFCTIVLLLLSAVACILMYFFSSFRIFMLIFGFAFCAYCASFFFTKVFQKYEVH